VTFFDVLKVFGPLPQEVIEKQRYAKWKFSDITKALKECRKPNPGPPGGDPNLPPNIADGAPSPTAQPPPEVPIPKINMPTPKPAPRAAPAAATPHAAPYHAAAAADSDGDEEAALMFDPEMISTVQKYCKFASSALNYEDVQTAIDNLEKALKLLRAAKH